jgi:two-component system chemotaxis response regulator CheY
MAESAAGSTTKLPEEDRRVLIVDDDHATRQLIKITVEGLPIPCRIYEAADGDAAIQLARRSRPDLALIDIVLPDSGASGVLVCRELCRDSRTKVVVVSGQASDSIIQAALAAGAIAYVRKPFSLEDLRSKVTRWLTE